jgi:hypothetical protein
MMLRTVRVDSCSVNCMKQCFWIPISILFDADPDPDQGQHQNTTMSHRKSYISLAKLLFNDAWDRQHEFLFSKLHEAVFLDPNFYFDAYPDPDPDWHQSDADHRRILPQVFFFKRPHFHIFADFFNSFGAFSAFSKVKTSLKQVTWSRRYIKIPMHRCF